MARPNGKPGHLFQESREIRTVAGRVSRIGLHKLDLRSDFKSTGGENALVKNNGGR